MFEFCRSIAEETIQLHSARWPWVQPPAMWIRRDGYAGLRSGADGGTEQHWGPLQSCSARRQERQRNEGAGTLSSLPGSGAAQPGRPETRSSRTSTAITQINTTAQGEVFF